MTISMRDFIERGRFGSIGLGASLDEARSLLGDKLRPKDPGRSRRLATSRRWATRFRARILLLWAAPETWIYGNAHLIFGAQGILAMIHAGYWSRLSPVDTGLIDQSGFDPWILHGDLAIEEASDKIREAGLGYRRTETSDQTAAILTIDSGVRLVFDRAWSDELLLSTCSLSLANLR